MTEFITWRRLLVALTLLLLALGAYFAHDIRNLWLLRAYSKVFEPEHIAENFRTLHQKYPTVTLARSSAPQALTIAPLAQALPESFEFDAQRFNVQEQIEARHLTSLVIVHRGQIVFEKYWRGNRSDQPVINFSLTKSLIGLLTGIALEQGKIQSLQDPVERYAPQLKGTAYEGVSIQNVLDMSSGVKWRESYTEMDAEIVQSLLASLTGSLNDYTRKMSRSREQGQFNQYTSMDTQVLGMVIAGATGEPLQTYFARHLWDEIGAESDAYFMTDKTGFVLAYGGFMCTPRDLAKVGLLMLNQGRNRLGEAVISPQWIRQSTTPDHARLMPGKRANADAEEGYKNQWWIPIERSGGDFSGIGIYGQTLYINPALDIVIASNSAYADYPNDPRGDSRRLKMFQAIAQHVAGLQSQ